MTPEQTKKALELAMVKFQKTMVAVIRDCAKSKKYQEMPTRDALMLIADKLEKLEDK
ncbi:MAG: hypothetical protein ACRC1D_07285 [Culicoidibacterales bacterium]